MAAPRTELVVLPTERHVERASSAGVTSARRFFERLRDALGDERKPASPALLRLLAKRAIGGADGATPAERAGSGAAADATVAALARAGASAAEVASTRTAPGRRIADLLSAVDSELARLDRADPRKLAMAASGAAAALASSSAELPSLVTIDGTIDLEGGHVDAWLAVHRAIRSRGGRGVRLRLPRFEAEADEPVARVAEVLEERLANETDAFEIEWSERVAKPAVATVLEAHGEGAEARAVAAHVKRALDAGARPDRIFIVAPNRDEALTEPLRAALRQAGIATSEAWGPAVDASPEARSVLALIDMAVGRLDRDALVELLHTPGLHPGVLVRERDEGRAVARAAELAARLGQLPVVQDRDGRLFVETLGASMKENAEAEPSSSDFWMVSAMEKLSESIRELRGARTISRFTTSVLRLIDRLRLGDPSAPEIRRALTARGGGAAAMRAIGEGAVAVRAVREQIEALHDAYRTLGLAETPMDLSEIALELHHALASARTAARGAAGRAGAVRIGELRETLGLEHDLLVVTRMAGRSYAPEPRAGLLDEATRRAIPARHRPRSQRERGAVREAEIAWAIASSSDVALSFSATDREGRETEPPHPRVLAALASGARRSIEPSSRIAPRASTLSPRAVELRELAAGAPPASDLFGRVHVELERNAFFANPSTPAGPFTGRVGQANADVLIARLGGTRPGRAVSVTFLERAYTCAFRAFADRVLRARSMDEITDVVGPRERGELLHRALFVAFEVDKARAPSATVEQRIAAAAGAIAKELDLEASASPLRREGRIRAAQDAIAAFTDDLARGDDFAYAEGERKFADGEGAPWGPLSLEGPAGEQVFVEGRIDRIDATPGGAAVRVVDYKTGRPRAKRLREGEFQVPLYALVAKRLGAAETSGVYIAIGAGGATAIVPTKESDRIFDDGALAAAARTAAAPLVSMWKGNVAPRPSSLAACKHCDARDLCRRPAVMPEATDEEGA